MYYTFIQLKMPSSHPTLQPKAKNLMQPYLLQQLEARHRQRGVTLIELLVGITLGLLVVAVGLGALMVSRGLAGSTSEAAQLQQQASYAFRVIGQQIRQAGSMELALSTNTASTSTATVDPIAPVGFRVKYKNISQILKGKDNPSSTEYALKVGYQNYFENQVAGGTNSMFRDCLGAGGTPHSGIYRPIVSHFAMRNNSLVCAGANNEAGDPGTAQEIIQNVHEFKVSYYIQQNASTGAPSIKKVNAAGVSDWSDVFAIEVCLDMVGNQAIDLPSSSKYKDCSNNDASYGNRAHQVFRNIFQIRSQGIFGTT